MTDRPIIFSAPMVRALLDGRKTQTRRIATSPLRKAEVGDRLWVRETIAAEELCRPPQTVKANARERRAYGRTTVIACDELDGTDGVRYFADDAWLKIANTQEAGEAWGEAFHYGGRPAGPRGRNIPSIHMPRWASRLWLEVEHVRVEQLQAISYDDAVAEGVERVVGQGWVDYFDALKRPLAMSARESYASLWMSLHGRDSWVANPEVVALGFAVRRGNIGPPASG